MANGEDLEKNRRGRKKWLNERRWGGLALPTKKEFVIPDQMTRGNSKGKRVVLSEHTRKKEKEMHRYWKKRTRIREFWKTDTRVMLEED